MVALVVGCFAASYITALRQSPNSARKGERRSARVNAVLGHKRWLPSREIKGFVRIHELNSWRA
jgi:hypothetical protein